MGLKKNIINFLAFLFSLTFVSAQLTGSLERGSFGIANIAIAAFGPFFQALLGGSRELLFERILIFFIIISIVYMVIRDMSIFSGNKAIVFIVSASVSLISIRFIQISEVIYSIILPYSVLGVAISSFIPLIIAFFFIHQVAEKSAFLRKSFWIFFVVVFFVMWELNYVEAGAVSWMYFWSAVLSFLFFLFDGTIRRAIIKSHMDAAGEDSAENYARRIRRELGQLDKDHTDGHVDDRTYRKIKRRLNKQLENLLKY